MDLEETYLLMGMEVRKLDRAIFSIVHVCTPRSNIVLLCHSLCLRESNLNLTRLYCLNYVNKIDAHVERSVSSRS